MDFGIYCFPTQLTFVDDGRKARLDFHGASALLANWLAADHEENHGDKPDQDSTKRDIVFVRNLFCSKPSLLLQCPQRPLRLCRYVGVFLCNQWRSCVR